ncbi:hypothetical protein ABGB08_23345 [Acrocarpospora sp. B8E8]
MHLVDGWRQENQLPIATVLLLAFPGIHSGGLAGVPHSPQDPFLDFDGFQACALAVAFHIYDQAQPAHGWGQGRQDCHLPPDMIPSLQLHREKEALRNTEYQIFL